MQTAENKKRGVKTCKNCSTKNGVRSHFCSNCKAEFPIKNKHGIAIKKINKKIDDWKDLKEGDCIRVLNGSGPYYNCGEEKNYVGHSGKFIVKSVDSKGIIAFGCSKNNHGFAHIYMADAEQSPVVPNLIRSPHKIIRSKFDR